MKKLLLPMAVLALLLSGCGAEEAEVAVVEDIAQAAPGNVDVLLDNDHLTVMKFTVPPQEELPMHQGRARIVYSLNDYRLQYLVPDYPAELRMHRQGEGHWHNSGVHGVKNVGATTAEYLVVTAKGPNPTPGVSSNLVELVPDKARVAFAHQNAQVIEVSLEPGDKLPPHEAAARAVYSSTDAKLRFIAGEEETESEWKAGSVHYHEGGEHAVENVSEQPVKYVVFEMM